MLFHSIKGRTLGFEAGEGLNPCAAQVLILLQQKFLGVSDLSLIFPDLPVILFTCSIDSPITLCRRSSWQKVMRYFLIWFETLVYTVYLFAVLFQWWGIAAGLAALLPCLWLWANEKYMSEHLIMEEQAITGLCCNLNICLLKVILLSWLILGVWISPIHDKDELFLGNDPAKMVKSQHPKCTHVE